MNILNYNWLLKLTVYLVVVGVGSLLLSACGNKNVRSKQYSSYSKKQSKRGLYTRDSTPRQERIGKYGNPPTYKVFGKNYYVLASSKNYVKRGIASWYGKKFHGRKTSSGEKYDMYKMTAAHKTLPIPTFVRVTNMQNGRTIIVRVNDRGPFVANRIIDLSHTAAKKLGILGKGTGLVEVRSLSPYQTVPAHRRTLYVQTPDATPKTGKPIVLNQFASNNRRSTIPKIETDQIAANEAITPSVGTFSADANSGNNQIASTADQGFVATVIKPKITQSDSTPKKDPFASSTYTANAGRSKKPGRDSQTYAQNTNAPIHQNTSNRSTTSDTWKNYRKKPGTKNTATKNTSVAPSPGYYRPPTTRSPTKSTSQPSYQGQYPRSKTTVANQNRARYTPKSRVRTQRYTPKTATAGKAPRYTPRYIPKPKPRIGSHKLYLQVGAFYSRKNARKLVSRVKSIRVSSARIHQGRKNNRPLYRVRIGPLKSVRQLDKLSQRLNRVGIKNTRVIVD